MPEPACASAQSNVPVLRAVLAATEVAPVAILHESCNASQLKRRISNSSGKLLSLARRSSGATEAKGSHLPDPWASELSRSRKARFRLLRARPRT